MTGLKAKKGFTFGADPEFFVLDEKGQPVWPGHFLPGDKKNPRAVDMGAVQVDGMAAEININPVSTYEEWEKAITSVMAQCLEFFPKGYSFSDKVSMDFPEEVFDPIPAAAKALGCSPDFNAWTGTVNPPPFTDETPRLRCAGGHIHFGWTKKASLGNFQHITTCQSFVKQLDWFLGAWSLQHDSDNTRRTYYGQAGAYRPKSYGVEYRVLSNFWLFREELRLEVWNRMNTAINYMRDTYLPKYFEGYNDVLVESIRSSIMDKNLEELLPKCDVSF